MLKTLLGVMAVFGIFAVLGWNVYAYGRYAPLELTFSQGVVPFAAGAVLLWGGVLAWLIWEGLARRRKQAEHNARAAATGEAVELEPGRQGWFGTHGVILGLVVIAGSLGLGGATMLCWAFTANALLDRSPAALRPVAITEMVMTTHSFLFREYTIEYAFLGSDETHKILSTPDHMDRFEVDLGLAEVHAGQFGWPWVRTIRPVPLNLLPNDMDGP